MKKLSALLLIFVLLFQFCFFYISAEENDGVIVGTMEYIKGTPSERDSQGVLLRKNINLGYEVHLEKKTSLLELSFMTGDIERGIVEIRLGADNGPVIGTLDTTKIASPDWSYSSIKISLSEELVGTQYIYICGVSGAHWIEWFKLIPNISGKSFAQFNDIDNFIDIADDANRHEINLLSDLGLISKNEILFDPVQPMTRIEFVSIIGHFIGVDSFAVETSPFNDISIKDENYKTLAGLYQLGIIKGDTEGNFRPYSLIKREEAATVCINALGYNIYAYDVNVILDIANKIDIFDGVSTQNRVLTKSDAIKMIYNLLFADYLAVSEFSSETVVYMPNKNFMQKESQYKHGKGIMTANSTTGLYIKKKIDGIEIDKIRYAVADDVNADFLGAKCEFFYREDGGERTICAIRPVSKVEWSRVKSGTNISFEKITERKIIFNNTENDEKAEYDLSPSVAIIYNGTTIEQSLISLIPDPKEFVGEITFIDNDADGECDCVWIDHLSKVIKVGGANDLSITDLFTESLYNIAGMDFSLYMGTRLASPEELYTDDYLMVYESSDAGKNKVIRAIMKKQTITGKISKISSNGLVTINDINYKVSNLCEESLYAGYEGTFILDIYDRIIEANKGIETMSLIGAFLALDNYDRNELAAKAKIKLLTEEGVIKFDVADRVTADGVVLKNIEDFYTGTGLFAGMENVDINTPVRYQLNSSREIKMIDTVKPGTNDINDTITKVCDAELFWYYNNVLVNGSWQYKYPTSDDVKLIALTNDGIEENYSLSTGYEGFGSTRVELAPYKTDSNSAIVDILLAANYEQSVNRAVAPFVFSSVSEKVSDKDDAVVKCISGTMGTGKVEYEVDMDAYSQNDVFKNTLDSLKEGDLIWASLTNGRVTSLDIIYIDSGAATNAAGVSVMLHSGISLSDSETGGGTAYLGEVEAVEKSFIMITLSGESWAFNCSSAPVVICEKNRSGKYTCKYGQSAASIVSGDTAIGILRGDQARLNALFVYRNSTY